MLTLKKSSFFLQFFFKIKTISDYLPPMHRRLDVDVVIIHLYVRRDGRANTAVYPPRLLHTLLSPVRTAARLHTLNLPSPDKTNVNSHYARPARGLNRWPRGRRFYSNVNLRYVANIIPRDGVFKNLPVSAICISRPDGKSTCTNLELMLSVLLVPDKN